MVSYRILFAFGATFIASAAQATLIDDVHTLVNRQSGSGLPDISSIPDQCKDTCAKMDSACTSPSCICSDASSSAVSQCIQCTVNAVNQESFVSQAQDLYNSYADGCKVLGEPVASTTFKLGSGALSNKANILGAGLLGGLGVSLLLFS